jgi:ankyrin repeat protein
MRTSSVVAAGLLATLAVVSLSAAQGDLRIVDAAKAGNFGAVPALIKEKADVTAKTADGTTALHWAAYWDNATAADLLIKAGANVNSVNDLGSSPLWLATENGSPSMVGRLLAAGANPNTPLLSGETPLMTAARAGNVSVVRQLLAKGAEVNAKEHEYLQTALMWATAQKHADVVEALLESHADVNARAKSYVQTVKFTPEQGSKNVYDIQQGGYTPILFAARVGDLESAKLLLKAGANINDVPPYGTSVLVLAAHSGHSELAKYLLDQGADPNLAGAGYSALHVAIVRHDRKLVADLVAAGADPNAKVQKGSPSRRQSGDVYISPSWIGATPIWLAARYSEGGMMRVLAAKGADVKFVHDMDYWTQGGGYEDVHVAEGTTSVLMAAAGMGHRLFGWDGDPEPDLVAEEAKALEAVKAAIELGAPIGISNADGNTALHMATARKQQSVVNYLLEKGADPNAKNKRGQTPAEFGKNGLRRGFGGVP